MSFEYRVLRIGRVLNSFVINHSSLLFYLFNSFIGSTVRQAHCPEWFDFAHHPEPVEGQSRRTSSLQICWESFHPLGIPFPAFGIFGKDIKGVKRA